MRLSGAQSVNRTCVENIHVSGLVQGVGFRPTVWRIAHALGINGRVCNNGRGVEIVAQALPEVLEEFCKRLEREAPPLAKIHDIQRHSVHAEIVLNHGFFITDSATTPMRTAVVADAATCSECLVEIFDPLSRRFRYPFTNCTHCGPRLSIVEKIPYDRANTTMAMFAMCADCAVEFADPSNRRFHAQPIACHACGPRAWLERSDGRPFALDAFTQLDAVDAAGSLIQKGHIVAIKGLGGIQLACDATCEEAVARLRQGKRRERKPFALMVRDLEVARRICEVSSAEAALLTSAAAPIVLLARRAEACAVAPSVAPGVNTLGIMLANTPLHHLLLRRIDRPIVLTSGNLSDEPQCIDNDEARQRLGGICDYLLLHDRGISQRVDDSVCRVVGGRTRIVRRSRGYAPMPLQLPAGFTDNQSVLALGAELKNTFCLLRDGQAFLSHHIGDLEEINTYQDYRRAVEHYSALFDFKPALLAADLHPEYLSTKLADALSEKLELPVSRVQHHHAHIAACLAENGIPLTHEPVIGVALDGLGMGEDGQLWGGEFLLADYAGYRRLATFKPVAMLGGARAIREPWRNSYAHLMAELGWVRFKMNYGDIDLCRFFESKDRALLDGMLQQHVNAPLASSCGRLFDAVAAAVGICREHTAYEGEAAVVFEALADPALLASDDATLDYPFAIPRLQESRLPYIEPLAMWQAVLGDVVLQTPLPVIAARFHRGLATAICTMVKKLSEYETEQRTVSRVALTGGVFQNRTLLELVSNRLRGDGFTVLTHSEVPTNDGGIAFGQAVIAAARSLHTTRLHEEKLTCV